MDTSSGDVCQFPGKQSIIDYMMQRTSEEDPLVSEAVKGAFIHYIDNVTTFGVFREIIRKYTGTTAYADHLGEIMSLDFAISENADYNIEDHANSTGQPRKKPQPWSSSEDIRLLAAILRRGTNNWNLISDCFGKRRSRGQCYQRWSRVLSPEVSKQKWTPEEDRVINDLVERYGTKSWTKIAAAMGSRSDAQCRFRYKNLLSTRSELMLIPKFEKVTSRMHRSYDISEILPILQFLSHPSLPRGSITKISNDTGIPHQTLSDWHRIRSTPGKSDWIPNEDGHPNRRIFSPETEDIISQKLKEELIATGIGATREDIKLICIDTYQSDADPRFEKFSASNCFVDGFMERNELRLYTPRHGRSTTINPKCEADFKEQLARIRDQYSECKIYNADETSWRIFMSPKRVIAEKGCHSVKLISSKSEKIAVTAIGAIRADGKKLPLSIIGKGKTERCLRKFGEFDDIIFHHSNTGWSSESVMMAYLETISMDAGGDPCCLIWDVYPSHRSEAVQLKAAKLKIELLFVPAGGTSIYQPLDIRVFGELKMRARAAFMQYKITNRTREIEYHQSITILRDCWIQIPTENMMKAWNILFDEL